MNGKKSDLPLNLSSRTNQEQNELQSTKSKTKRHQTALGITLNIRKVMECHSRESSLTCHESIILCSVGVTFVKEATETHSYKGSKGSNSYQFSETQRQAQRSTPVD